MLAAVRRNYSLCIMCDKARRTNKDGWCEVCTEDFKNVQARERWSCQNGPCNTPVSCAMKKNCLSSIPVAKATTNT
jgi:hypothetical protein